MVAHIAVHFFQRPKETGKLLLKRSRPLQRLTEILVPKLRAQSHHRRTHRPVFVRPLRPCHLLTFIYPKRETQMESLPDSTL